MISCKLYGGLGNQMFMYACALALSLKYNMPYCIPKHTLNDEVWKPYYFENVNYCGSKDGVTTAQVWKEPSHAYHEIPKPEHRLFVLDGYMQSWKYSNDYLPEIRKAFGFDNLDTKKDWCSIHVRRGDYLLYPDKHPVVSSRYLILAIEKVFLETGILNYLVFGDDIEWNKDFFRNISFYSGEHKIYDMNFSFPENKDEVEDLKLMASCQHNIIANSTFSWWGAYLNNNPNKIVVTPDESNWFGSSNNHLSVEDLLPKEWVKIKY